MSEQLPAAGHDHVPEANRLRGEPLRNYAREILQFYGTKYESENGSVLDYAWADDHTRYLLNRFTASATGTVYYSLSETSMHTSDEQTIVFNATNILIDGTVVSEKLAPAYEDHIADVLHETKLPQSTDSQDQRKMFWDIAANYVLDESDLLSALKQHAHTVDKTVIVNTAQELVRQRYDNKLSTDIPVSSLVDMLAAQTVEILRQKRIRNKTPRPSLARLAAKNALRPRKTL